VPHQMADLPVGDVHCRYDDGTEWVLERKTVRDLASSIRLELSI
jgi:ERCC4-type nuclease